MDAFVIPGDIETRTGGYNYERCLLHALRARGREVAHIEVAASFPHPSAADEAAAIEAIDALPEGCGLILDGLVFGSIQTGALARVRVPIVAMLHHPLGLEAGLPPERAAALIARETNNLRLARHVVVPSPHTARLLVAEFGVAEEAVSIAPPGFERPAQRSEGKDDPPLLLAVGIICERKGHDVLIQALATIRELRWQAMIVGMIHDPCVEARLRRMVVELGLEGRVRLTGCVADDELEALYGRATTFALATRYEGYGLVFAEAALHGLPIVTCATGAVPETVPEGAGLLVPPNDPAAFGAALRRILEDHDLRRGCAAAASAAAVALPNWSEAAAVMGRALDRVTGRG